MASSIVYSAWRELRGRGPSGRLGQVAVVVYLAASIASVVWGLSAGPVINNALGAIVEWRTGESEGGSLTIENRSPGDWNHVRVYIDQRFYLLVGHVPAQGHISATFTQFSDGYVFLRPDHMFPYESTTSRPPETASNPLSGRYRPNTIRLLADEGDVLTHTIGE